MSWTETETAIAQKPLFRYNICTGKTKIKRIWDFEVTEPKSKN